MAVVAGLLALAASWGLAEPVAACSCIEQTEAEAVVGAEVAFVGTVIDRDDGDWETSPPELPVMTYEVDRVYAGDVPEQIEVMTTGTDCNAPAGDGEQGLVVAATRMEHPARELTDGQVADLDCAGTRQLTESEVATLGEGRPPTPLPPGTSSNDLPWLFLGGLVSLLTVGTVVALVHGRHRTTRAPLAWEDGLDDEGHAGGR
jgi:hypothetical protein